LTTTIVYLANLQEEEGWGSIEGLVRGGDHEGEGKTKYEVYLMAGVCSMHGVDLHSTRGITCEIVENQRRTSMRRTKSEGGV
jgi:hypothetical protein